MESSKLYLIQHEKMFIRGLGTGAFVPTQELSRGGRFCEGVLRGRVL